ncbi:unnamed protein product [Cuscuta epithymum]|uniref:Protein PHYTOCHROME KINASE SUBSTRATE 1-like n=1 Tax=Cuscuta epithymum TaxID=186058 RepID=A0AAV0F890_9ASTE|nr:unnamed protein product [Cuscuta epithymum]
MALVVLPSEPNPKITTKAAPFPSFLDDDDDDESFELNIDKSIPCTRTHKSKAAEDGEIDVFSADKYFNEAFDQVEHHPMISRKGATPQSSHHHHHHTLMDPSKSQPRTSSVRSEPSWKSWNSRSHLLVQKTPRTNHLHHHQPPANSMKQRGKSFLAAIGRNYCSCNGKNSTQNDDISSNSRTSAENPPLRSRRSCKGDNLNHIQIKNSPVLNNPEQKNQLQDWKCLNVLDGRMVSSWEVIDDHYDDTGSESSSDLFEIESFLGGNSNLFLPIDISTRTSLYAPSEASIEWSVVTASAVDFSVASDSEEPKTARSSDSNGSICCYGNVVSGEKMKKKKKRTKRLSSILMGCRNEKAVGVAGDEYRSTTKTVTPGRGREYHGPTAAILPLSGEVAGFSARTFSTSILNRQPQLLDI